ncbi:phosphohistidine phosphatase [Flammeovirgaceae bacterium 311]|nr:phosphohistidine phosphatase [Flammeovirgaceae bacterium 311]
MNKELLLIRHSDANPAYRGQSDAERELTESGAVRAMHLANYLKSRNLTADALFSGISARGRQTAELLGEKNLKPQQEIIFSDDIYESSVRIMFSLITNLDENLQRVYIVGHNPILTYLTEYLTGNIIEELEPCGVLWLSTSSELNKWSQISAATMILKEYMSPATFAQV